MKKKVLLPVLFAGAAFVLSYILCCYIPALRIKLSADAFTYFKASVRHMVFFKTVVSAAAAAAVGLLTCALTKETDAGEDL